MKKAENVREPGSEGSEECGDVEDVPEAVGVEIFDWVVVGEKLEKFGAVVALSTFVVLSASAQTINENVKFVASDAAAGDLFGGSVAISGTMAIVVSCPVDYTGDGKLNFLDVSAFLVAFSAGCP